MIYEIAKNHEIDVPQDVIDAAIKIHNWMIQNGSNKWELMDICSRNHADDLRMCEKKISTMLQTEHRQWTWI